MKKLYIIAVIVVVAAALAGCKTTTQKAFSINTDIKEQVEVIADSVAVAQTQIGLADKKVIAATTQPGNPPKTTDLLRGAHNNITEAANALSPIAPAAQVITEKAEEAATLTKETEAKLVEERDHWLGYKTRRLLYWVFGIGIVFGVGAFIIRTFGLGVIGSAIGDIFGTIWKVAALVLIPLWHVFTLGLDWLGKKINAKYDSLQKKE